jgi:hypothetical protein
MKGSMEGAPVTGPFSRAAIRARRGAAGAAVIALLAALPAGGAASAKPAPESAWIRISYRELLDPDALTHAGARLADAMRRKASRGDVQPFLDPYSSLLGYAVQMLSGADPNPQSSLAERYPAGAAQPAWAAILRSGKYFVSTDGQGRARVFVPGDEPRTAYRHAYSVIRHPLAAAIVPGVPLQVDVFAYRNDYAAAELRLDPAPYRFRAQSFPPRGRPLSLDELDAFFRQGGQLEGAELVPAGGLVLYASQARQRLGGEAVSLADLAVAYRAVFHAGDAEAFVSLDRSADPTQATVNFGGLLEDTRVGKAVLAADVRFKTITSGLDPVTHADIREQTRRVVPSFMSNSERHFLANPTADLAQWILARYWYYPDSCGVEADEDNLIAAITRTQLTADVERTDGGSGARRGKKPALPAGFRENIRDLNENYASYATVFPEYPDLSSAARLMALAAWLGRVRPQWLDLDALLAVTLPPVSTPRTVPQLLSAEILNLPGGTPPDREYVLRNTRVHYLTPELDRKVPEFFGDARHLAVFLAYQSKRQSARPAEFAAEAGRLFPTMHERRVRDLVRTPDDLHAFLRSCAARLLDDVAASQPGDPARDRRRLDEIRAELAELAALPANAAADGGDEPRRLRLERELTEMMRKYHAQGAGAGAATIVTTQYTGGVSLAPRLFSVKKSATRPALEKLKTASRTAGTAWGAAGWIRSGSRPAATTGSGSPRAATPAAPAAPAARSRAPRPAAARTGPQPTVSGEAPEEVASTLPSATPAMSSIAVPGSATPAGSPLVGRIGDGRSIVFTRAAR